MKYFSAPNGQTSTGLAYGPSIPEFIDANPGLVDYIEIPFEQLRHTPNMGSIQEMIPVVLHCASMSIAGSVPPSCETIEAIRREADRTETPWIGEHLAFITADDPNHLAHGGNADNSSPTVLTYTVCPQMSEETVARVADNLAVLEACFKAPLILENSPQYFAVPGSTMSMTEFINQVFSRCDAGMLLDLSHFLITMLNTGSDAAAEIERLPLERVVEIHISGLNAQSGIVWDDHATPAPAAVFRLLQRVLERVRPRAVTVEYNWSPSFPQAILKTHLERIREMVEQK
ncbi:MAG TPA: DUF692 family protein [Blastocatellia bacterium]|nr:DUF692 family protein [Blastocatellia bacterium]